MAGSRRNGSGNGGLLAAVAISGTLLTVSTTGPQAKVEFAPLPSAPVERLVATLRGKAATESGITFETKEGETVTRLAQWWNFLNCFNPYNRWRNC
jgi:hypothetical protein